MKAPPEVILPLAFKRVFEMISLLEMDTKNQLKFSILMRGFENTNLKDNFEILSELPI
jgi:hypothetical protein